MRVSIRLREPALSIAELVPGNGRLAAVRWSNLDLGARPSGYRWRAPSVINIQPLTTYINPHSIFVGTAVAVQIRSYLLRSGSLVTLVVEYRTRRVGPGVRAARPSLRTVCGRQCATSAKGRGGPNVCNCSIDEGR